MGQSREITGTIHSIDETKSYGQNNFEKRTFVILVTGEGEKVEYPNYVELELTKDKCPMIDGYAIGQEIKVYFNLGGRIWDGGKGEKCFVSLTAWKIEAMQAAPAQQPQGNPHTPAPQIPLSDPTDDSDSIPFACCAI